MNVYLALFFNFLPFVLCFVAFRLLLKVSVKTEIISSIFGLVSFMPIVFLKFYLSSINNPFSSLSDFANHFSNSMLYSGFLEEGWKCLFIFFIPWKKLNLNSFFASSFLFGICLGCFESVTYVMDYLVRPSSDVETVMYGMIFVRMISSDVVHGFCAGLCGLFVWSIHRKDIDVPAFIFAVLAHGFYDFFASFTIWVQWFAVAAILFAVMECRVRYVNLKEDEELCNAAKNYEGKKIRKTRSSTKTGSAKGKKAAGEAVSDATIITSGKKISKSGCRTKTKSRKVKNEVEKIPDEPDVTPEFNDEI